MAAEFGLHPSTFCMHLHEHEPGLAKEQGMVKGENGKRIFARATEKYKEAVRFYETIAEDLKSIAQRLGIVYNSLSGYVKHNRPDTKRKHEAVVRRLAESGFLIGQREEN